MEKEGDDADTRVATEWEKQGGKIDCRIIISRIVTHSLLQLQQFKQS